jgi:hypothetical protein
MRKMIQFSVAVNRTGFFLEKGILFGPLQEVYKQPVLIT